MCSKIDQTLEQLQTGLDELFQSDKYKLYLDTMSKFHSYSVNNCILIALQKPDASLVAGYTAWRDKFHRQVLKGETGITIIAPTPYKKSYEVVVKGTDGRPVLDEDGKPVTEEKEFVHQAFRICKVFDISQTEGEPLPELISELKDPVDRYDDLLQIITDLCPVPVKFDNIDSGANGYFSPKNEVIVIKRGMPEEQTLKTLVHECAHARLGHGSDDDHLDRRTHEVQAESVAYCVCKAIGLDTSDFSFPYIAGWSSDKDTKELKASLHAIRDVSDSMIAEFQDRWFLLMDSRAQVTSIDDPGIKSHGCGMAM